MAFQTTNLDLYVWDLDADNYDHGQLASNWQILDDHDHNEAEGRGKYIDTDSLASLAVTNAKLADCAVTKRNICGRQVGSDQIEEGAITQNLLDPDMVFVPLGMTSPWFRPNGSVDVPDGWHIADGSTLAEDDHDWGAGSVTLPDLRNRFVLGAATSGTGTTPDKAPAERASGGAHTKDLGHTHNVAGHSHTVASHSHTVPSHAHGLAGGVASGGTHAHGFTVDGINGDNHIFFKRYLTSEVVGVETYEIKEPENGPFNYRKGFLAIANRNSDQSIVGGVNAYHGNTNNDGAHSHDLSGSTQQSSNVASGTASPSTSSEALTTASALSSNADIRPGYTGLLYIVKVKN